MRPSPAHLRALLFVALLGCSHERATGDGGLGDDDAGGHDAGLGTRQDAEHAGDFACTSDRECDDGIVCDGPERCFDGRCSAGVPEPDGTPCDTDGIPNTREVCADARCSPSRCGDRIVDPYDGEECDDGNARAGDGCFDCQHECRAHADCDDGNPCNGSEACDPTAHVCRTSAPPAEGSQCLDGDGRCASRVCLRSRCDTDDECDDGDPCNGAERCAAEGTCELGGPVTCDDGDPCTEDRCDRTLGGCVAALLDDDGDGFAPAALGACGADCDDRDATVFPGGPERCDGRDNDCDGDVDEDGVPTWYADCDGDGFAAAGAPATASCRTPSGALSGCPGVGRWTLVEPAFAPATDCNDGNALVHPGQRTPQGFPIRGAPSPLDYDYDCDGVEERLFDADVGSCVPEAHSRGCVFTAGWVGERAECGEAGLMLGGCRAFTRGGEVLCAQIPETTLRAQRCL